VRGRRGGARERARARGRVKAHWRAGSGRGSTQEQTRACPASWQREGVTQTRERLGSAWSRCGVAAGVRGGDTGADRGRCWSEAA
jgi:hypothetical protein